MLIEAPYKKGDTVSIKLTSGEEIVARLDEEARDYMMLHKPMCLVMGQNGVGLAPFMMSVNPEKEKYKLLTSSVAMVSRTDDNISKTYVETTTGLKLNQEDNMSTHEQIVQAFNNYLAESETFEDKSVKAAAARARKALGDLGKLTKERRKEIQDE